MAKGFDGSRPDIGWSESRVTTEDRLQWDKSTGAVKSGMASRPFLDVIVDNDFWDVDPEVTRVGAFTQAIQSRVYAGAEITLADIRRQLYLVSSNNLQRFSDRLGVRARDLPLEGYRSRLRDLFLAYQDAGAVVALSRVIGSYTGCPIFATRTLQFPGYWIVASSYLTSNYLINPDVPFTTFTTASSAFEPVLIVGASSGTTPGKGTLEITFRGGYPIAGRWRMPEGNEWGDSVEFEQTGRYELVAGFRDTRSDRVCEEASKLTIEIVRPYHFPVEAMESTETATIELLPTPDSFRDGQNWIPDTFNARSGIIVEALGMERLSSSARDEMMNALLDVADLPPLSLLEIGLEQPGRVSTGTLAASAFWPDEMEEIVDSTSPVLGTLSVRLGKYDYSTVGENEALKSVPQDCGPYLVIKERFNRFEDAFVDNFELSGHQTWRLRDELVGQPRDIPGVVVTEVNENLQTGQGRIFFHPGTGTLQFQAPDLDDPTGLDPEGIAATLDWNPAYGPITGVALKTISCPTPPGTGTLIFTPAVGPNPAYLSWGAPEGVQGAQTAISSSGTYALASGGAPAISSGGPSQLVVEVTLADLPNLTTTAEVFVEVGNDITRGGDMSLFSGDSRYKLQIRVSPNLLPEEKVFSYIRFRSAELRTYPVSAAPLGWVPPTSSADNSILADFSILDRVYSENVIRTIFVRQGDVDDEESDTYTDWEEVPIYGRLTIEKQFVQFKIVVNDEQDHFGFPTQTDYEFVAIALRPSFTIWTDCYFHFDDFTRIVTSGFEVVSSGDVEGTDDLYRDLGLVVMGYDGEMATIVSPCVQSTLAPPPSGTIVPEATGTPPTSVAEPPIATLVVSATGGFIEFEADFDASGSTDPDGTVVAWQFDFGDGDITPWLTVSEISHLYRNPGIYTAKARVRDNDGLLSPWDSQTITVLSPPTSVFSERPIAGVSASATTIPVDGIITYDMSSSIDLDGFIIGYRYLSGDGQDTGFISSPIHSFTYAVTGDYQARFQVMDNVGLESHWSFLDITVVPAASGSEGGNQPPIADLVTFTEAATGLVVDFDLSGSYDDSQVVRYQMDFGDGVITGLELFPIFTHAYATTGSYTARGRVQDDTGLFSSWVSEIVVVPEALYPVADIVAVPSSGIEALTVVLSASGSTDDDGIAYYQFDPGDGTVTLEWSASADFEHVYETAGTYSARVRVQDVTGLVSPWASTPVVVGASDGTPTAFLTATPSSGDVSLNVTLDGLGSVDDIGVTEYYFEGGDGYTSGWAASTSVNHTYTSAGFYTARLKVRDVSLNVSDWSTVVVQVKPVVVISAFVP